MGTDFRSKTDPFFYDNYTRTWVGRTVEQMVPVYCREMKLLLLDLEQKNRPVRLPQEEDGLSAQLTLEVVGQRQPSPRRKGPFRIVVWHGWTSVYFVHKEREVFSCTPMGLLEILEYYVGQLGERFQVDIGPWTEALSRMRAEERKRRRKKKAAEAEDECCLGEAGEDQPEISLAGAKSLHLRPGDLSSIRQLNCQDTLRSLEIDQMPHLEDMEELSQYTGLKTLYLRDMGLRDVGFLAPLTQMVELGLPGNGIADLSPLAGMKQLNHLYAADNPATDFSVVEELSNLRDLYVDEKQMPDGRAWDKIPERISLHVLRLQPQGDGTYHSTVVYERLRPEKPNPLPTRGPIPLEVGDRWLYSGLREALGRDPKERFQLRQMKSLDCSDHVPLCKDSKAFTTPGDYSCLKDAIKLRSLNLSGREVRDFDWLRGCINLQSLDLSYTAFGDLSLLSGCTRLKTLNLSGCKNLRAEDMERLKQMTGLKSLDVSDTALADYHLPEQEPKRWKAAKATLPPPLPVQNLPAPPLIHSGYSEAEIQAAEERIGVRLPEVYRRYLMACGKDPVNRRVHRLFPPEEICTSYSCLEEELPDWVEEMAEAEAAGQPQRYEDMYRLWKLPREQWAQVTENYVLIWAENQGVWMAGYRLKDLAEGVEQPPVYLSTEDDFITFAQLFASTEDFLAFALDEAEASPEERELLP